MLNLIHDYNKLLTTQLEELATKYNTGEYFDGYKTSRTASINSLIMVFSLKVNKYVLS